jgi:tetratricopeptide (TPR) repeat protein
MKRIFLIPVLLFLLPFLAAAQSTAKEWHEKGIALKTKEVYDSALEAFKKSIAKDKNYSESYFEAGWCCNELEKYDDAVEFLKKYTPVSNEDKREKYNEIGYSYYKLEKSAEAIESYALTLALYPDNGIALRGTGNTYYELNENYDKAIEFFEKAIEKDEESSGYIYGKLGWLYNDKERYDDAIAVLKKAIVYDSEDPANREEIGYAYYAKGDYEQAMTQLNKAIEINAESWLGYYYKGLCFVNTNKKGDAMGMYYKLKELNPDQAKTLLEKINSMK